MSIDEVARTTARRTTAAVAAATDADSAYRSLLTAHRRRVRAKVVAASAFVLALLLVVFVGSGVPSHRRSEPIAPQPTETKPFRAAPPFCGPAAYGDQYADYVKVGGICPAGPGRYLSLALGIGSNSPFAFTLPEGWSIREIAGVGGGPVMPALGGLLLQSTATGHALVLTEFPTQVRSSGRRIEVGYITTASVAHGLATNGFVRRTTAVRTTVGGRRGWRVDLLARPDAAYAGHCLVGDRCAVTFALAGRDYPGRSYLGLVPNVPSTAFAVYAGRNILTVLWTWGDPDADPGLGGLIASLDLDPPAVCDPNDFECSG
jgi:hypothetical protein